MLLLIGFLVQPGCSHLPGEESGKVVIRIATWGGAEESDSEFSQTIRGLWRQFEKENPGVVIREEKIPGSKEYVSKMLLSFVAGTEPDIMSLDASSAAIFIENGVLMDLRPLIDKDPSFSLRDYFPNVVKIASRGQSVYAIPGDFTPMVVYYNKKLFDAAGVPYPSDNWTFDEFIDKARRLTKPEIGQWGFKFDNWMPGWIVWIWNNGDDVLGTPSPSPAGERAGGVESPPLHYERREEGAGDGELRSGAYLNSEKTTEAVTFLRDMINVHKAAPTLGQVAALGVNPFMDGKAAMEVAGHWEMVGIKAAKGIKLEDIGVAPWPSNLTANGTNGTDQQTVKRRAPNTQHPTPSTVMYEVGLAISRRSKHPEIAWRFVKFLTSRRYQEAYQRTGIAVCARKDVAAERAKNNLMEQKFLQIVPSARAPWGASVEGYDYVETEGPKMMDRVLAGGDVKGELDEAVRRIDGYFRIR